MSMRANPTAIVLSTAMLFRWLSERHEDRRLASAARMMETAVGLTMESGLLTPDIGGVASTAEFGDALEAHVRAQLDGAVAASATGRRTELHRQGAGREASLDGA